MLSTLNPPQIGLDFGVHFRSDQPVAVFSTGQIRLKEPDGFILDPSAEFY